MRRFCSSIGAAIVAPGYINGKKILPYGTSKEEQDDGTA